MIEVKQSTADQCVYIKTGSTMTIIAVYVDDLILSTSTVEEKQEVKESSMARFKMKDMGKLHYCLGVSNKMKIRSTCGCTRNSIS